jgi:Fur family iron response transcriptional regulator
MLKQRLIDAGIRPTAQRLAVAEFVLATTRHPSADQVFEAVSTECPTISQATVYNTLKTFTERGLLRQLHLRDDRVVYDPKTEPHHHFVDIDTGEIQDIDWRAIDVARLDELQDIEICDYQVVLRGRRRQTRDTA